MSCDGGCGITTKYQPEFYRRWKPESNAGCCCGGPDRNDCDKPSLARVDSPLWEWEQVYGKLVETITYVSDDQGHTVQKVEKHPCGPTTVSPKSRHGCCVMKYRVNR
jgi:hypothetical protein